MVFLYAGPDWLSDWLVFHKEVKLRSAVDPSFIHDVYHIRDDQKLEQYWSYCKRIEKSDATTESIIIGARTHFPEETH